MRLLDPSETAQAASLLARAFDADPMFQFLFEERRARWLHWIMAVTIRQSLRDGVAIAKDDAGALAGVVLSVPPGKWPLGIWSFVRAGVAVPPSFPPRRMRSEGAAIERAIVAKHPLVPHWYIYVLGIEPSLVGRGLGGALLGHALAQADAAAVPAHLETTNPKNLGLYRKFGFEVTEELLIGNAPPTWIMARPARLRGISHAQGTLPTSRP